MVKKQQDLEENNFGFVDISHRRYKLRRDVEQTDKSLKQREGEKDVTEVGGRSGRNEIKIIIYGRRINIIEQRYFIIVNWAFF